MDALHGPTVRLELTSRPEAVALVRAMLAGVGDRFGFPVELLADMKTAVSEACNNVVMHAYDGELGPLEVELALRDGLVEVVVRDRGRGIHDVGPAEAHMGVGLAVISALSARAEFASSGDAGTEVRMGFAHDGKVVLPGALDAAETQPAELSADVTVTASPVSLLGAVLPRLAGCVAADAYFSVDRYSDLYLVMDAVVAHARRHASTSRITAGFVAAKRRLELTVGPFRAGTSARLQAQDASDSSPLLMALLVDHVAVETLADAELLRVVLIDAPGGAAGAS